jgi:hypothetical protein
MFNETAISNPFPGLRAFEEDEDILFFGREKQVDELVTKLRTTRFIAVIGSSGSGKSSLVKSGLIPSLQSGFMSGAGSSWRICSFRPGNNPIGNMAKAIVTPGVLNDEQSGEQLDTITAMTESTLRRSSNGLVEAYKQSGISKTNNLLILVDQFEEIFRFSKFEQDSKEGKRDSVAFINLLLKATSQADFPIFIVFTMRSDFLSDCTEFRGLPEAINDGNYLVPRMTREERKEAITGPIAVANAKISQRLLNLLLNDVGDNPDQLPILQHSLMRTWDLWKKKKGNKGTEIDFVDYEAIGTMKNALSQHAEEAYAELKTDKERRICESIFKTLTDKGSDSRGIRRPSRMSELCEISNASFAEVSSVIEIFRKEGRAFLMPPQNIPLTESSIIDISHESIMRVWVKLMLWVDTENESAQVYIRLSDAAVLYEEGRGGLWRDPELQVAWNWKNENQPNKIWAQRYNSIYEKAIHFLEYSKQQFEQEILHKEELQKRRLRRVRRVAIIVSLVAVVALFLALIAYQLKIEAATQTTIAQKKTVEAEQSQHLAVVEKKKAEESKEVAVMEKQSAVKSKEAAIEQKNIADREKIKAERSRQEAIVQKTIAEQQQAYAERERLAAQASEKLAREQQTIAQKQTALAIANEQLANDEKKTSNRLKDLSESRNLAYESLLLLNEKKVEQSKLRAIEAYQLNANNKGPIQNSDIFNALQSNWVSDFQLRNQLFQHKYPVRVVCGKPATSTFFSGDEQGMLLSADMTASGWQSKASYNFNEPIRTIACSADGTKLLVLTASEHGFLVDISSASQFKVISAFTFAGFARALVFTGSDGFLLLSNVGITNYKIGATISPTFTIKSSNITDMLMTKSGHVYTASGNTISLYNNWQELGKPAVNIFKVNSKIISLAVDDSEAFLAAGTYDGRVWIRDIKAKKEVSPALHLSSVNSLRFAKVSTGRLQLASGSGDQTIKLIDVRSLFSEKNTEDVLTLKGHAKWIYGVQYSADAQWLISCSEDNRLIAWKPVMADLYQNLSKK